MITNVVIISIPKLIVSLFNEPNPAANARGNDQAGTLYQLYGKRVLTVTNVKQSIFVVYMSLVVLRFG